MPKYRILNACISYPPNNNVYAGDIVDDLPTKSVKWLLEDGHIELADDSKSSKKSVAVDIPEITEETVIDEPVIEEGASE